MKNELINKIEKVEDEVANLILLSAKEDTFNKEVQDSILHSYNLLFEARKLTFKAQKEEIADMINYLKSMEVKLIKKEKEIVA